MSEGNQEDEKPPPESQRPHQEDGTLLSSTLPDMHCIKTLQATSASVLRMVSAILSHIYNILIYMINLIVIFVFLNVWSIKYCVICFTNKLQQVHKWKKSYLVTDYLIVLKLLIRFCILTKNSWQLFFVQKNRIVFFLIQGQMFV